MRRKRGFLDLFDVDEYDQYYKWLDDYNADQTQPYESPIAQELCREFDELSMYEAVHIIMQWAKEKERKLVLSNT